MVELLRDKMAEFPNSLLKTTPRKDRHKDAKSQSHKKKTRKERHVHLNSQENWNVTSPSFTATMSWPSSCTAVNREQTIKAKLKKIKKEGRIVLCDIHIFSSPSSFCVLWLQERFDYLCFVVI